MSEERVEILGYRMDAVERRLDNQEKLSESRHEANTARLEGLGKHLTTQDATLGAKLSEIATKLAVADGVKAQRLEDTSRTQNRWYLFIAAMGVLATLFSGSSLIEHFIK